MTYAFDAELAPVVATLPSMDVTDPVAARAAMAAMMADAGSDADLSGLDVDDYAVPGPEGAGAVTVRVYRPKGGQTDQPALLYIHGGGFFLGSIDTDHVQAATLASRAEVVVASVEYRLAPEYPFPAGLDDCYAALQWLSSEVGSLGIDPGRIGVFGQSAGGGLAAAVALVARDRGGPALCFQFLGIPELDDRLDTPSMRSFVDTPFWNRPNAEISWGFYLGDHHDDVSYYAAPARATDLSGLPPAYVSTMEFDPLRDEGIIYALRLLQAGVGVELHSFPGTFHGSGLITGAGITKRVAAEQVEVVRRRMHPVA